MGEQSWEDAVFIGTADFYQELRLNLKQFLK
jgi:hypothetical protein